MSKIKVLPGQRWLKSTGPHRDQNIILHILEVTPRRFYAIAHVVGVNAAVDNGPVLGVEAEKAPALVAAQCVLMGDGETAAQCLARFARQSAPPRRVMADPLRWRPVSKFSDFPIMANSADRILLIYKAKQGAYPYHAVICKGKGRNALKARWTTLAEAQAAFK